MPEQTRKQLINHSKMSRKRPKRGESATLSQLESRVAEMNLHHEQLLDSLSAYQFQPLGYEAREEQLEQLTKYIEEQIARVRRAELELELKEKELQDPPHHQERRQRLEQLHSTEESLDRATHKALEEKAVYEQGSKDSVARIRAKLIIKEKEIARQTLACQQERQELSRLSEEIKETNKQLLIDRSAIEQATSLITEEESKLETQ